MKKKSIAINTFQSKYKKNNSNHFLSNIKSRNKLKLIFDYFNPQEVLKFSGINKVSMSMFKENYTHLISFKNELIKKHPNFIKNISNKICIDIYNKYFLKLVDANRNINKELFFYFYLKNLNTSIIEIQSSYFTSKFNLDTLKYCFFNENINILKISNNTTSLPDVYNKYIYSYSLFYIKEITISNLSNIDYIKFIINSIHYSYIQKIYINDTITLDNDSIFNALITNANNIQNISLVKNDISNNFIDALTQNLSTNNKNIFIEIRDCNMNNCNKKAINNFLIKVYQNKLEQSKLSLIKNKYLSTEIELLIIEQLINIYYEKNNVNFIHFATNHYEVIKQCFNILIQNINNKELPKNKTIKIKQKIIEYEIKNKEINLFINLTIDNYDSNLYTYFISNEILFDNIKISNYKEFDWNRNISILNTKKIELYNTDLNFKPFKYNNKTINNIVNTVIWYPEYINDFNQLLFIYTFIKSCFPNVNKLAICDTTFNVFEMNEQLLSKKFVYNENVLNKGCILNVYFDDFKDQYYSYINNGLNNKCQSKKKIDFFNIFNQFHNLPFIKDYIKIYNSIDFEI